MKKKDYCITCLVGATGSGKTSVAQYITLQNYNNNIPVWSNVPLYGAKILDFKDLLKYEFTNENMKEGVFIIDEAGICLNNRDWEKLEKDVIKFFKLHRHFRISVYIFSQGEDIDITFRRLAHKWYKLKKLPFGFTALIPVINNLTIKDGKWCLTYEIERNFLFWKYIPIFKTWQFFNSFSVPNLPKKDFETWDVAKSESKFEKFKHKLSILKGRIKLFFINKFLKFRYLRNKRKEQENIYYE